MTVRFWGVRGSMPCPGSNYLRFGGNTSCIEILCGARRLILDAGSGLRELNENLAWKDNRDIDLLLSHCHFDHVIGLSCFAPLFDGSRRVRIWGFDMAPEGVKSRLGALFNPPLFPVPIERLSGEIVYQDRSSGQPLDLGGGIIVHSAPLSHPGGSTGFRVEWAGRSLAYLTDFEIGEAASDRAALNLARQASLAVIDASYTDDELEQRRGWGHSSWRQAAHFARDAGVQRPFLFHHEPARDDAALKGIESEAKKLLPAIEAAREGAIILL
jgi:phosphoribosyl 1,2-cyclic phosphodiesterase